MPLVVASVVLAAEFTYWEVNFKVPYLPEISAESKI